MLPTLVLDGEAQLSVCQLEAMQPLAGLRVTDDVIDRWFREAGQDDEHPQPAFRWRVHSSADQAGGPPGQLPVVSPPVVGKAQQALRAGDVAANERVPQDHKLD